MLQLDVHTSVRLHHPHVCVSTTTNHQRAGMDVDDDAGKAAAGGEAAGGEAAGGDKAAADGKEGDEAGGKDKVVKEKEPSSYSLTAPCRVVPQQVKFVSFPPGAHKR